MWMWSKSSLLGWLPISKNYAYKWESRAFSRAKMRRKKRNTKGKECAGCWRHLLSRSCSEDEQTECGTVTKQKERPHLTWRSSRVCTARLRSMAGLPPSRVFHRQKLKERALLIAPSGLLVTDQDQIQPMGFLECLERWKRNSNCLMLDIRLKKKKERGIGWGKKEKRRRKWYEVWVALYMYEVDVHGTHLAGDSQTHLTCRIYRRYWCIQGLVFMIHSNGTAVCFVGFPARGSLPQSMEIMFLESKSKCLSVEKRQK